MNLLDAVFSDTRKRDQVSHSNTAVGKVVLSKTFIFSVLPKNGNRLMRSPYCLCVSLSVCFPIKF
jgi:hypothetical protein